MQIGDRIAPSEQKPIGGFNSVKGYRENYYTGIGGLFTEVSLFVPLHTIIGVILFADYGYAENERNAINDLSSFGVGIKLHWERVKGIVYYGYPIKDVKDEISGLESDIQDSGIHFCISVDIL